MTFRNIQIYNIESIINSGKLLKIKIKSHLSSLKRLINNSYNIIV